MARLKKLQIPPRYLWPKTSFVMTKHSSRMCEVIDTIRREGCMGLICGVPGVGKTLTAERYVRWQKWEDEYRGVLSQQWLSRKRVKYLAVHAANTPLTLLRELCSALGHEVRPGARRAELSKVWRDLESEDVDTLIIDEADRLGREGLEVVRDLHDRTCVAVVLMGMPGMERKMEGLGQLTSRVGFYYPYAPLTASETATFMDKAHQNWAHGGDDSPWAKDESPPRRWSSNEEAAIGIIHRVTDGIPREIRRMVERIERLLEINNTEEMVPDLAKMAAKQLFHGSRRWPKSVFMPGLPKAPSREADAITVK